VAEACTAKSASVIDEPVSVLPVVAEQGKLTIMVGGAISDLEAMLIAKHYGLDLSRLAAIMETSSARNFSTQDWEREKLPSRIMRRAELAGQHWHRALRKKERERATQDDAGVHRVGASYSRKQV
jgi:hypothetical protein